MNIHEKPLRLAVNELTQKVLEKTKEIEKLKEEVKKRDDLLKMVKDNFMTINCALSLLEKESKN